MRLWCLMSLSFEFVVHEGGWVLLWCGLKLSTGCTGSRASQEVQAKVSCHLCPARGPPSKSSKVICRWLLPVLGLRIPKRCQAANQGQLLLVLGLGQLAKDTEHTEASCSLSEVCEHLQDFREVQSMSQDRSFIRKCHWKSLG